MIKAVAGECAVEERRLLGVQYWYWWDNLGTDVYQIPMAKGEGGSWSAKAPWINKDSIQHAARNAQGPANWFILGNEWTLHGYSPQKQADMIRQACDWIGEADPTCRVVVGGWTIDAPHRADRYAGLYSVQTVREVLKNVPANVLGVHLHAYFVQERRAQYESLLAKAAQSVWDHWGKKYVWLTEFGHTRDAWRICPALGAVEAQQHWFHIAFWYKTKGPGDMACNLFYQDGLTEVGKVYREWLG